MAESHDLTKLDSNSFEHLVNHLALCVLGAGHTGFGPGADGGRDGFFEGVAPYPSETNQWSGTWYIQSKFHKPHLSKDPQKWLLEKIKEEIKAFKDPEKNREWPDNWIIATNIDPSGVPMTGAFDKARAIVSKACPKLKKNFHIWGGSKIIQLLVLHPEVSKHYSHFLTPGHVLSSIFDHVKDAHAEVETIIRFLITRQFKEHIYTKLDQAGAQIDARPGIHHLFIDLPFRAGGYNLDGFIIQFLVRASGRCHRINVKQQDSKEWRYWNQHPSRARVWFIKGGPGQGKSTIGQYYCQIQRAFLILQKSSIPVRPEDKTLAEEIKQIAEKNGFWPQEPRIPISIELREYAQWFGQHNSLNQPHGILTYLAGRISAGVEQPVLTGTLKRALGRRSWFVLFDGLDEVPHDVKDGVAQEVLKFIDDVSLECGSDLLTVCTSRPQGYAGQFSELDGPTIDLVNLSPEQALECAMPVITFNRSKVESKKTLTILKSAIESKSVQELMTTPLQSHIMAIVVRDGGRPPDRRWQLFNNFYQVIKRREANRDLPDKKLAKLLREDDQLLKTVHNRLGFILHSRAETSSGAQTHLIRAEFKNLIENAVIQMIEEDIQETVNILMEATTDRLVLVSTPDDGGHLRFDIRPLQEFFAAEFIYESISAEELRKRLDIIAGDAHWREVMHFLLSAFIENDRRTELSVAISILEYLNEGEENNHIRLLMRRLGRGAFLTARLLQEGVLEQDKRLRQQFRKCLEPLTSSTQIEDLLPMILVSQTNSLTWLINFLFDTLHEADRNESIGAVIVLTYVLPDDDKRVEVIRKFLLDYPAEFNSIILEAIPTAEYDIKEYPHPKEWYLDIILTLLLREDFYLLSSNAIRSAINILGRNKEKTIKVAENNKYNSNHIQIIKELLYCEQSYFQSYKKFECDYGIIKCNHPKHDWTTGTYKYKYITNNFAAQESNYPGILQLLYRIFLFNQNRTLENFVSIFTFLKEVNSSVLESFPRNITVYLPIDKSIDLATQINELASINEGQFNALFKDHCLGNRYIPRHSVPLELGSQCNIKQWGEFINNLPEIALHILPESFWVNFTKSKTIPEIIRDEEAIKILIDKIIEIPSILLPYVYIWGYLLKIALSREVELRRVYRDVSCLPVSTQMNYPQADFYPFRLKLPEESALLPHILSSLLSLIRHHYQKKEELKITITKNITEIIDDLSILENIITDSQSNSDIKAASLFLLILHHSGQNRLDKYQSKIIQFYYPGIGSWYFNAISVIFTLSTTEKDANIQRFLGNLLYTLRKDHKGRRELNNLISTWRENSYSPIQNAGVLHQWLNGSSNETKFT